MNTDLHSFVDALEKAGELLRITEPVSPVLEVAALADLASKSLAPNAPSDS
ncbi:MAG: hypothetical protein AAGF47_06765, partial [Planctomycetota bacterium]